MATHGVTEYHIERFWDDEFKTIDYIQEPFNDPTSVNRWISQGYQSKICGDLCDMRHRLPPWTSKFIEMYESQGWKDVGLAFYRMRTGTVMPVHSDLYKRYIELFNLQGQEMDSEDWQDVETKTLSMYVEATADQGLLMLLNAESKDVEFTLPEGKWGSAYRTVFDSAASVVNYEPKLAAPSGKVHVTAHAIQIWFVNRG